VAAGDQDAQGLREQIARNQETIDRLNQDLARRTNDVRIIQQISTEITSTLDLGEVLDIVLGARPQGFLFEGANPRHEHEWTVFEGVDVPEGKILIPGVLDSTNNYIEHPELVAQRIERLAHIVGRENVMAGSDCGFATFAQVMPVDPAITWAKLASMAEGARLASERLWGAAA
jgi:5-methyltetrahydropteroyltriglutamate--homocysteine methyltransferase